MGTVENFLTFFMDGVRRLFTILNDPVYINTFFPFLLLYIITYQAISQVQDKGASKSFFSSDASRVFISLLVAYVGTVYEFRPGVTASTLILALFPGVTFVGILILIIVVIYSLFGLEFQVDLGFDKENPGKGRMSKILFAIALVVIGTSLYSALGFQLPSGGGLGNPFSGVGSSIWNFISDPILIVIGIIYLIIQTGAKQPGPAKSNSGNNASQGQEPTS